MVDLDPAKPQGERLAGYDFVPVDARPMLTIDVQTRPSEDPTDAALEAVGKHAGEGLERSIVRLRVEMDAEQEPTFREPAVRQALVSAFHLAGIERRVRRTRRTRLAADDAERFGPLDALRRYFESRSVPAERERALVRYAEGLLQEEAAGGDG